MCNSTPQCLPCRRVCVCFSSAIYVSFAVQAPHTLLLWLRWAKSHWQRHKKLLLSACLQKQQFRLERKEKNINFLAWLKNFQKRPWPFFVFSVITALPLAHAYGVRKSNPAHTQTLPQLHRSQSERICGIAASCLQPAQYNSNRFHQRTRRGVNISNPRSDKSASTLTIHSPIRLRALSPLTPIKPVSASNLFVCN